MKNVLLIISLVIMSFLSGCSNEPKESDKLLSDYKNQQLDKAKKVEQEMNNRVENLNRQLEDLEEKAKDEPQ